VSHSTANDVRQLEALIDKHGLETVLEFLRDICCDKAEHVATEWQDASLAKIWVQAAVDVHALGRRCGL
jgi:hypothetical protein